jgi:hypothetical protein
MPIHDWNRVRANRFHDFHQRWTVAICDSLNGGLLPPGFFAMIEQKTGGPEPDVVTLGLKPPHELSEGGTAVAAQPPRTRFVVRTEAARYADKANRVTIRHPDGEVVAIVEVVSPGNKDSQHAIDSFARKAAEFLRAGIHLLIVDLFPPGRRDPQGIHPVIWERFSDESFALPADKPLTAAAYCAGAEFVAYVEPLAVGDMLPEMPLFFHAERYINCPLEPSYQVAWAQYPQPLKADLEFTT